VSALLLADVSLRLAVKYVAAAYAIVWALTLLYVWLIGSKLRRMERDLADAEQRLAAQRADAREPRDERVTV
jgi:CcmD family protein